LGVLKNRKGQAEGTPSLMSEDCPTERSMASTTGKREARPDYRPRCVWCQEIIRDDERMCEEVWAGQPGKKPEMLGAMHYDCYREMASKWVGPKRATLRAGVH
jgi:hypothetical protein